MAKPTISRAALLCVWQRICRALWPLSRDYAGCPMRSTLCRGRPASFPNPPGDWPKDAGWRGPIEERDVRAAAAALGVTLTEDAPGVPIDMVFDAWRYGGDTGLTQLKAHVLGRILGPAPDLHGGATFAGTMRLDADAAAELRKAAAAGFQPTFWVRGVKP